MNPNGCHNRMPFKDAVTFGNLVLHASGFIKMDVQKYKFRFARDCMYDKKTTDKRCKGCKWI